jgi:hypothetical protein
MWAQGRTYVTTRNAHPAAKSQTEKELDEALAAALQSRHEVARWLFDQTRFAGKVFTEVHCRHDNPWSSVYLTEHDARTGEEVTVKYECETDVLAVFTTPEGRFGLHIENKVARGCFTPKQPELYQARLGQWKGRDKLLAYQEATSVLIAPQEFLDRCAKQVGLFETIIAHEELAYHIPEFRAASAKHSGSNAAEI